MTENGKIFLTKKSIFNLLSQQQFSIGLSLYIIQDIEKQLEQMYNKILFQDLQEQQNNDSTQQIKQQQVNQQQEQKQQIIDMTDSSVYPVGWIPADQEEKEKNEDQAN